jgi:hypothetical protein
MSGGPGLKISHSLYFHPRIGYSLEKSTLIPWRPVLRETVPAVDRSSLSGLERNFALAAAVGTDCLMKLAGTVLIGAGAPA